MAYYIDSQGERHEITTCRVFRADPRKNSHLDHNYWYVGLSVNGGERVVFYPIYGHKMAEWNRTRLRVEYNFIRNGADIQVFTWRD
jgi:hypothetical protein